MSTTWFDAVWQASGGFAFGYLAYRFFAWRRTVQKQRIVALLRDRGELSSYEICRSPGMSGWGVYLRLRELESAGVIASRSDGVAHPERGGRERIYYRLVGGV